MKNERNANEEKKISATAFVVVQDRDGAKYIGACSVSSERIDIKSVACSNELESLVLYYTIL